MVTAERVLRCIDVSKLFGGVNALAGVSVDFFAGEVHALVGENGAGKSTLLGILSGRVVPTSGTVEVRGVRLRPGSPRLARHLGIAAVYQELTMIPALSSVANVFLGKEYRRGPFLRESAMRRRFEELGHELGMTFSWSSPARALSIAEQQTLEMMGAVEAKSEILLLDEPSSALAEHEREALFRLIRRFADRGVTVVFVSHNLHEVLRVSDRITVLRDGTRVATKPTGQWTSRELVQAMLGREVQVGRGADDRPPGRVVLSAEVRLNPSLPSIALSVRSGEIVGLAGLVGSGRTRLLRALAGAEPTVRGELWLDGERVKWPRTPVRALAKGIAMIPEDRKVQGLILGMTAADNITLSQLESVATVGYLRSRAQQRAAESAAQRAGLAPSRVASRMGTLSGGNQQKVLLARWLHRPPRVLLADEPTRGIDVGAKAEMLACLRQLARDGLAVLMTSSELEEVLAVSDRVLVLSRGRLVDEVESRREKPTVETVLRRALEVS